MPTPIRVAQLATPTPVTFGSSPFGESVADFPLPQATEPLTVAFECGLLTDLYQNIVYAANTNNSMDMVMNVTFVLLCLGWLIGKVRKRRTG